MQRACALDETLSPLTTMETGAVWIAAQAPSAGEHRER
jgi:hypothetical protein